jgi:hypothetical protein
MPKLIPKELRRIAVDESCLYSVHDLMYLRKMLDLDTIDIYKKMTPQEYMDCIEQCHIDIVSRLDVLIS